MLISSASILSIFMYMFYMNYLIQDLNNGRECIFTALYNSEWYRTPVSMQKLLLFIMLRTLKGETFNLLVVFTPSLEVSKYVSIIFHGDVLHPVISLPSDNGLPVVESLLIDKSVPLYSDVTLFYCTIQ
ncbi:uncharacterized protein LOC113464248 isoform X1 [Ceratina calcarata]|uniref:Uncharacterized protein LOC113464248 isoform X1 n=1 Tax=Ceratina calcarata TaxID=156304 RepID=A0AAJ7S020_9HYME|nr:uncharacterized protein LOC113464248 isoform X1 [Ceratina calcarata]